MTQKTEMEMFDEEFWEHVVESFLEKQINWLKAHDKRILEKAREMTVPEAYPDEYFTEKTPNMNGVMAQWNSCSAQTLSLWDKYINELN